MTYPSNSADGQVRAFIDRILRMKEEEKAIKDDIKEIYAEAKANGFDKTQLGRAVTIVQKRQKDGDAVDEADAILDLYLAAYYGTGTRVATHTHAHEDHDPETGEVLDTSSTAARKDVLGKASREVAMAPRMEPDAKSAAVAPLEPEADTQAPPVDIIQEPPARETADPLRSEAATREDAGTAAPDAADEAEPTQVEASSVNPHRPHCLKPKSCASINYKAHCYTCSKAHADAEGFAA